MRIVIIIVVVLSIAAAGFFWANRSVTYLVTASLPANFPEMGFSHRTFEALLQKYVDSEGGVDYDAWHRSEQSIRQLDSYLAAVAHYSPESTPERFATRSDAMAYWMYGYNAYVVKAVLSNWPIASVTDVKAPIEAVKGLGFFYRNRYLFGNEALSLLTVENKKIRERYKDPRIHFVLNCASESCPILRPELPTGEDLELLLVSATREFVSEARNVRVDHKNRRIHLSAIFKMYEEDFINHVRADGKPGSNGILTYIMGVAAEQLREEIASAEKYEIVFSDFDWRLNGAAAAKQNQALSN